MENKRYYGIDIGGTTVKVGLFEGEKLLDKWSVPTVTADGGRQIIPDIAASLRGPAAGAALAVPGAVLPDGTVNRCVNLGWGVCRPTDEFTALTGIPCKVLNDANAAALGEQRLGGGKGFESVLFVALGTGVGAGVVLDGKLRVGARGTAGEIGHLCWDPTDTAAGNARLAAVADKACDILGWGIAGACAIVDPAAVVLGGGVALAGEYLRSRVQAAFEKYAFHACLGTEIRLATLGSDAGMIGTALYAMD